MVNLEARFICIKMLLFVYNCPPNNGYQQAMRFLCSRHVTGTVGNVKTPRTDVVEVFCMNYLMIPL